MVYALRKLIAFVFLGGLFWFIFRDLDNLDDSLFLTSVGALTVAFFFFWTFIPIWVVRLRVRKRRRQNRARFEKWLETVKGRGPQPFRRKDPHVALAPDESLYFREKGTLYVERRAGFESVTVPGRLGEVAFPGRWRSCRKAQRTHFRLTDRRLVFAGRQLRLEIPLADLKGYADHPGGIVFTVVRGGRTMRMACTFQNPLIVRKVLDVVTGGRGQECACTC